MSSLMMPGIRNTKLLFSLCFFYQSNCDQDLYLLWGSTEPSAAKRRCVARKKSMRSNMWRADHRASTTICPTLQKNQNGTSLLGKRDWVLLRYPLQFNRGIYPHVVLLRERLDKTTWCQNYVVHMKVPPEISLWEASQLLNKMAASLPFTQEHSLSTWRTPHSYLGWVQSSRKMSLGEALTKGTSKFCAL